MDVNDFLIMMLEKGGTMESISWSILIWIVLGAGVIGGLTRYILDHSQPEIPLNSKWRIMQYMFLGVVASGLAALLDRTFDIIEGKAILCFVGAYGLTRTLTSISGYTNGERRNNETKTPEDIKSEDARMLEELKEKSKPS
ncbi:MAG: hypothetical protein MUF38_12845, partial [Anaerolineae bacterium]|nr:hypothetical protein [Anaerolineae bacterium]